MTTHSILKLRLQQERHVVHARQRARDLAALLGFDRQEQVRLATATSELTRNAFRYAREGSVEFLVSGEAPASMIVEVTDRGPGIANLTDILDGRYHSKTGLGKGLTGTRRLMDQFHIETSERGTRVTVSKQLPSRTPLTAVEAEAIATKLAQAEVNPYQEVERQNQDLMRTLAELREKQEMLAQVNTELEDTNRGVVALYAELEQSAGDLRRISDQKTSFLSNLSHEFRTPLNAILALCQILNSRADGELTDEQEKQVGFIRRSAADLSELVDDLLDVAKVEAGKVDIKPTLFAVEDLFGALRGMLRTLVTSKSVELSFTAEAGLPLLYSDESKISQILRNLISNALKFTREGRVSVSAEQDAGQVVFRVSDTGIGIAPEDRERIFDEFVQVSGPMQTHVRGTGLGLPLSRKLAHLLGGTLRVQSTFGSGSTFTVILPMEYRKPEVLPTRADPPEFGEAVVLIVEDNPETRFVHQSALRGTPYATVFARSQAEARVVIAQQAPVAIVLDRMLDGVDALPLVVELRAGGYRGIIIVVSVVDEPKDAIEVGADSFLAKPIPYGELADTLVRLLGDLQPHPVLLVDDDEINRYVLSEALAPFNLRLLEARSGREAMRIGSERELSAIFLDMSMPGLTGLETFREMKRIPSIAQVPVVIHSSKELSEGEITELEAMGALIFPKRLLSEPHAHDALRSTLAKAGIVQLP